MIEYRGLLLVGHSRRSGDDIREAAVVQSPAALTLTAPMSGLDISERVLPTLNASTARNS